MDNTEVIKSLINNIEAGNMTDAGDDFSAALDLKLADILSARREEMANAVFNTSQEVETGEEPDEDV
jgi:hypothetical protein